MANSDGWIKIYRKFSDWEWFNISEMVHLFIYLLINANHQDGEWRGIKVKRGQIITGRSSLYEKTKISEQTIRTCLTRLEKTGEITRKSTNKYSIITICKYEDYQTCQPTDQPSTNQQLTSNQPATNHKQEEKELKNKKNEYILSEFYDSEIEKSNNDQSYTTIVKVLFGENKLHRPLNGILKLEQQLLFSEFSELLKKAASKNKSLTEMLENMENGKYYKNKVSIYRTLLNWINKD